MARKVKSEGKTKAVKAYAKASFGELKGWKTLVVESDRLSVTVLPEHGGWILSCFYKPRNVELLQTSPRGLLAKDDPPVVTDPLFRYRDRSPGGWPELFPHGSGPVEAYGVKLPFHGEVVNREWRAEIVSARGAEAVAHMSVDCHLMPLRLERTLRVAAGSATFVLEETATNLSDLPFDFMWGHHPIFGKPLLAEGAKIFAEAQRSLTDDFEPRGWPMDKGKDLSLCPAEGAGTGEMFYLDGLKAGWYALVNAEEKLGAAMAWDREVFPYVWIWREAGAAKNYPYFGRAYAVAIEPFSSLPGARQRGERLLHLDGGQSLSTKLVLTGFHGLTEVSGVTADGEVRGK
ncbi:MAG TPA: DUF4432 family protein [Planctomycetota bacterium]|nr:DUF4432 family protein [Planctomycetota bacterium]